MACCGKQTANRAYEITYGDGTKEVVSTLAEARMKILQSDNGGKIKPVTKPA